MTFFAVSLGVVGVLILGSFVRVMMGPTVWDRLLGVGLMATKVAMATVLVGLILSESFIFDLALAFAILGFLLKVLIARYVERQGDV